MAQWDVSRNASLTPDSISYGSKQKVWWRCTEGMCGRPLCFSHTGEHKGGCPVCAGQTSRVRQGRIKRY